MEFVRGTRWRAASRGLPIVLPLQTPPALYEGSAALHEEDFQQLLRVLEGACDRGQLVSFGRCTDGGSFT